MNCQSVCSVSLWASNSCCILFSNFLVIVKRWRTIVNSPCEIQDSKNPNHWNSYENYKITVSLTIWHCCWRVEKTECTVNVFCGEFPFWMIWRGTKYTTLYALHSSVINLTKRRLHTPGQSCSKNRWFSIVTSVPFSNLNILLDGLIWASSWLWFFVSISIHQWLILDSL